ncbi:MAG: hydrogen peroxide-dependent heme synthase [Bryobacter sp.]|nr:hydrogen peroxide-dependent heme synthase [Bryobacter sp.]
MSVPSPQVPLTLEGAALLHQMFQIDWSAWRKLTPAQRSHHLEEASAWLAASADHSALVSLFGHKGDFMMVHFRPDFPALSEAEWSVRRLGLWEFCRQTTSYTSVVELGLYESTGKVYGGLTGQGIAPHSEDWNKGIAETLERQRAAMAPRLFPQVPPAPYVCFYPMDRKRGEDKNWYSLPLEERAQMMHEHGMIGRRYAGEVRQIISGSIGFDDWEWGVDLFAEDPLVFKKLIYEMRFDPVSAIYALFGSFYIGIRKQPQDLATLLTV